MSPKSIRIRYYLIMMGLLLGIVAVLTMTSPAQAATLDKTTPDTAPPTTVSVPADLERSWQGLYHLPAYSLIRHEPLSLTELIKVYTGQPKIVRKTKYQVYYYNPSAIYRWLNATLAPTINVAAQEPRLNIANGRAVEFQPPQVGRRLNVYQTTLSVIQTLEKGGQVAPLVIDSASPRTELSELNNLGIKELLARGQSNFAGSPRNRRHNIAVGVSKMKGVLVGPGEEFSFNKFLGPVEAYAGFKPELVIKKTGTVPELGGGLCQVSSTTFRAAMKAGFPIVQRRNHSYAVQYYAPQGTDATIYPGVIDLKFTNDSPGSILIWPYFPDDNTLIFDIYGTADDREVTLDNPVTYDRRSDGSMKAYWTRTVTKNGAVDKKTFNSVYQSPALFHKQEEFVANPTAPAPTAPADPNPGVITPTPPPQDPPATATSSNPL